MHFVFIYHKTPTILIHSYKLTTRIQPTYFIQKFRYQMYSLITIGFIGQLHP